MRANRRRHAPLVRCGYGVRDKRGLTVGAAGIRFKLKDLSSCSIMTIDRWPATGASTRPATLDDSNTRSTTPDWTKANATHCS